MPKVRFAQSDLIRTKKTSGLIRIVSRFFLFFVVDWKLESIENLGIGLEPRTKSFNFEKFDDFNPLEENFHLCD